MKNKRELLDCDSPVERCTECPRPEGCIWECAMESYKHENVAKIREEEDN